MTDAEDTDAADDDRDVPSPDGVGGWLRRRRWQVAGLLVAAVAAVVVGTVLLSGGDDDDGDDGARAADRPLPTPPPAVEGDVDEEGQELLDLLSQGHERTYHATYTVTGDPDVVGSELRLEVWRRDGLVRQDMHQETEAATVEAASFLLDDETISCQRVDEGDWTCARQAQGDEFTAAGLFGNIARELEGAEVVVTDEEIADRPARCFTLTGPSGEVSQCMSDDGIPLSRRGEGAELVLVELSEDVPDDVFTPPAEPATGE